MKILLFFIIVVGVFSLLIISNNNLSFLDDNNIKIFMGFYGEWVDKVFLNLKVMSGDAIKMDWAP